MNLPDPLDKASVELRNATAAWRLVEAAGKRGDDIDLRQFADEARYAVTRAAALIDEFLTLGGAYMADTDGAPW